MAPIHKERYILSKETYGHYTLDVNAESIDKQKIKMKNTSYIQIGIGGLYLLTMLIPGMEISWVLCVLAFLMIVLGVFTLIKKGPKYEKDLWANIEKSYLASMYDKNDFDVKFYEDKLTYSTAEIFEQLSYNDFLKFVDEEKYFGVQFVTGDLILMNPDCDKQRIKDIVINFRKKNAENEEE